MAIENAVIGAIADLLHLVINAVLKSMGYSEIESKKLEAIGSWLFIGLFCALLIGITLIYS